MSFLKEKLQNINSQLIFLLPQFKSINARKYNEIPLQINNAVVGNNKVLSYLNKTIREITDLDLNNTTTIANDTFSRCTDLTSVTIPNSVTTIGSNTFYYCTSLTNVTIPNSVTTIGNGAFYGCTNLTSVTIPNRIKAIANSTFYYCTSLTNVTIPDSVTSIGSYAFDYTDLTSVTIPNNVTTIGTLAFYRTNLTSVYLKSTKPPIIYDKDTFPSNTKIYVPVGSGEAYKTATNWSSFAARIIEDPEL